MLLSPVVTVDQPGLNGTFSITSLLVKSNHPEKSAGWPAWAVAAFIHTLGADTGEFPDLYVTYISDVTPVSTKEDRTTISLIEIDVRDLYTWDWGPVRQDARSRLVANTETVDMQAFAGGTPQHSDPLEDRHHDFIPQSV